MSQTIAIVTPAFKAEDLIGQAVRSVLAQSNPDWEHWIIADDLVDYEALLAAEGLADKRQRFRSTGRLGGGSTTARNQVFDEISTPYAAILDADDRFKPKKLELALTALQDYPIISVALDVLDDQYRHLRHVGDGPDRALATHDYKLTSFSMDSMIVWDRRVCDGRYDTALRNMTDLDFLMRLWRTAPGTFHLGTPLHDYVKIPVSMSNGPGVTERMIAAKSTLLERIRSGFYPMQDPRAAEGLSRFLQISLKAEAEFDGVGLFEDHLEPRIRVIA